MSRHKKDRIVSNPPLFNSFKPIGVEGRHLHSIFMSIDEYEAIRLADFLGLNHEEAAIEMEISRSTFTRLIERARKKLSQMLVKGNKLNIEGGNIHFKQNIIKCNNCGHMFKIDIKTSLDFCPNCETSDLFNIAGSFGHGKCCFIIK